MSSVDIDDIDDIVEYDDQPAEADDDHHHHAPVDDPDCLAPDGSIITFCGLRMSGPRPGAAKLPCCPLCALSMGRPCR